MKIAIAPLALLLAPIAYASAPVDAQGGGNNSATASASSSGDCSLGFVSLLAAAYRDDVNPTPADPNAVAPHRRAMDSPLSSPPFPAAEWQLGGVDNPIGVPNENSQYPLVKALACTSLGRWMHDNRIEISGWAEVAANASTSDRTNYPLTYTTRPNRLDLNQLVLRIERLPDTVQTDHVDWGFHLDNLYGYDYHFTTMKGVFSNQLLNHPNQGQPLAGKVYGYDPIVFFGILYIPWIGRGTQINFGRYYSLPDIESNLAPGNYFVTHTILNTADAYTTTGVLATTILSDQWTVQFGLNGGDDVASWNRDSRLTAQACIRWVSSDNSDMFYPCVQSWNGRKQTYNNLNEFNVTWGHRFSDKVHTLTEAYRLYVVDQPGLPPGQATGIGIVNYFNVELDPNDMISFRNEWYNDEQGQRTGFATRYSTHTLGLTHWISQDMQIRPEVRYERSYNLNAYDNGHKNHQATALVDVILHF